MTTATMPPPAAETSHAERAQQAGGPVRIDRSLVDRACMGDETALHTIMHQFIEPDERIEWCGYLGVLGIPPFGLKSFAVLTPRRIGSLRIGWLGYVLYQDAPLEYTVSGLIMQPSKLGLYLWITINTILVLAFDAFVWLNIAGPFTPLGISALVVLPMLLALVWLFTVRLYYSFRKCGLLWAVREGLWVYVFTNRSRMNIANRLHRRTLDLREQRIRDLAPLP